MSWVREAADGVRPSVRAAWRRAVLARGTDVTDAVTGRTTVVVAPHPDDETLGCGATIARLRAAGTRVVVVVVADGRSSHPSSAVISSEDLVARRADEVVAACSILGVDRTDVRLLGFRDGSLDRRVEEVTTSVEEVLSEVRPDQVLVTSGLDAHSDHRAVNVAVRAATRPWGASLVVAEYPVWFWWHGPWLGREESATVAARLAGFVGDPVVMLARLRPWLVRTEDHLDRKRQAIQAHRTQVINLTGEPDWATFPEGFVNDFLQPVEVFLPVDQGNSMRSEKWSAVTGPAGTSLARDDFTDDHAPGTVIGTVSSHGARRGGADRQGVLSVDGGAGRIQVLPRPGWGRAVLSYGPFAAEPGTTFVALVLNGHNTSQTYHIPQTLRRRVRRLLIDVLRRRLRFRVLRENLAVGWFPRPVERDPAAGAGFVMHSAGPTGGELRVRRDGTFIGVAQGVQNIPIYYVVALREQGAVYYISSIEGADGFGSFPSLRPVGIDSAVQPNDLYASIQQSVLGEILFRAETRIHGIEVLRSAELSAWCQTAHAADRAPGRGTGAAERGGTWYDVVLEDGARVRTVDPGATTGMVHGMIRVSDSEARGLVWRESETGAWAVVVDPDGARLLRLVNRRATVVARDPAVTPGAGSTVAVQVLDDGGRFTVHVGASLVFDRWFDPGEAVGTGVGIVGRGDDGVRDFEAHPSDLHVPGLLRLGTPWGPVGDHVVVDEDFDGVHGELDGHVGAGDLVWRRDLGSGRLLAAPGGGVRADADVDHPHPGRTIHTVAWTEPGLVDLAAEITPPGTSRGQGHGGRAGVVFYEDDDSFLIVSAWLDDAPLHDGSSVSAFLRLDGLEESYDAVWSNVGRKVTWGVRHDFRVVFDGDRFLARVDGHPVLERAVSDIYAGARPLHIQRVGVAVNWEYGDDTGSTFHRFVARRGLAL